MFFRSVLKSLTEETGEEEKAEKESQGLAEFSRVTRGW